MNDTQRRKLESLAGSTTTRADVLCTILKIEPRDLPEATRICANARKVRA